jgi:hypothetical protein
VRCSNERTEPLQCLFHYRHSELSERPEA